MVALPLLDKCINDEHFYLNTNSLVAVTHMLKRASSKTAAISRAAEAHAVSELGRRRAASYTSYANIWFLKVRSLAYM